MEIATAKIKIKDRKEEITKIIDDTYLRPSYKVKKLEEGVYWGHVGILGVFGMGILKFLHSMNLLDCIECFSLSELVCENVEVRELLNEYKEIYNIH